MHRSAVCYIFQTVRSLSLSRLSSSLQKQPPKTTIPKKVLTSTPKKDTSTSTPAQKTTSSITNTPIFLLFFDCTTGLVSQVDEENTKKISSMTTKEIEEAQQEIMRALDPSLVALLRNRGKNKNTSSPPQSEQSTQTTPKTQATTTQTQPAQSVQYSPSVQSKIVQSTMIQPLKPKRLSPQEQVKCSQPMVTLMLAHKRNNLKNKKLNFGKKE